MEGCTAGVSNVEQNAHRTTKLGTQGTTNHIVSTASSHSSVCAQGAERQRRGDAETLSNEEHPTNNDDTVHGGREISKKRNTLMFRAIRLDPRSRRPSGTPERQEYGACME